MSSWIEYVVQYEVRTSRQTQSATGRKWSQSTTEPVDEEFARRHAANINAEGYGDALRNARVIMRQCTVVG